MTKQNKNPDDPVTIDNDQQPAAPDIVVDMLDTHILTRGRVVVIGLGGIGLHLVRAIVTFLGGLLQASEMDGEMELLLCDGDVFAIENTYRMDVPDYGNKADVVAEDILAKSENLRLIVRSQADFATEENVAELVQEGDCVMLCCDNHDTRNLISRHCTQLENVVLISGGNDGVEDGLRGTYANVQVHVRANGQNHTAPIHQFHPEIADPADQSPHKLDCLDLAAAGAPQLLFTNLAVASAMCNALYRLLLLRPGEPMYDEVSLDIFDAVCTPHWFTHPEGDGQ